MTIYGSTAFASAQASKVLYYTHVHSITQRTKNVLDMIYQQSWAQYQRITINATVRHKFNYYSTLMSIPQWLIRINHLMIDQSRVLQPWLMVLLHHDPKLNARYRQCIIILIDTWRWCRSSTTHIVDIACTSVWIKWCQYLMMQIFCCWLCYFARRLAGEINIDLIKLATRYTTYTCAHSWWWSKFFYSTHNIHQWIHEQCKVPTNSLTRQDIKHLVLHCGTSIE